MASSISDDGRLSSEAFADDEEGIVEAGIPPQSKDASDDGELNEEAFSVDDFDADMSIDPKTDIASAQPQINEPSSGNAEELPPPIDESPQEEKPIGDLPDGEVAEFRKTLSALSRQLEIDRLTFLYQQLQAEGSELPPLERIASDIKGDSALHPLGDQDLYSKKTLIEVAGVDIRTLLWGRKKSQEIFPLIPPSRRDMTQVYDYSVIIPAYNEEEFLPATLEALEQARNELKSLRGECIFGG